MNIKIGKNTIDIPSWSTITPNQYLNFCRYMVDENNPAALKLNLLFNFCGLKPIRKELAFVKGRYYQWFLFRKHKILIPVSIVNILSEAILGIFYKVDEDFKYSLNINLTRNIIPDFKIRMCKYTGPADALTNITFKEFIFTDTFYIHYCETNDKASLDKLISVLFRPQKRFLWLHRQLTGFNGDNRIRFNDYRINSQAKKISRLTMEYKLAILYFFIGSRKYILSQFPDVFSGSGTGGKTDTFKMYLKITDALAQSNPVNKEAIRNELLYDVLDSLNNMIIQAEEIKRKTKRK